MLIGSIQIELFIPTSSSLKEKRFILKSIKTKLANKFNISIAEVDYQEKWQRSCLGIATVSNSRSLLDEIYSKILNYLHAEDRIEVIDHIFEIV